ncbi:hypothetical protein AX14_012698 [Amanita brunnescens Koide BX004]|nr:hypothetical protein AX14_012698 [Amanita brunnescens Koide BX004]
MHLSLAIIISLIFVSLSIAYPMQGPKTGERAKFKKYRKILQAAQARKINTGDEVSIGSSVRILQGSLDPNDLRTGKALRDGDDLRLIMVPVIGVTGMRLLLLR